MFERDQVQDILRNFCNEELTKYEILDKCRRDEKRYIIFCEMDDGEKVVLKLYSNVYTTPRKVDIWAFLSLSYSKGGILTPRFLKSLSGSYSYTLNIQDITFVLWLEQFVASENKILKLEDMDASFIYDIGRLKGKMHRIAKESGLSCNWDAPLVLFSENSQDGFYDENFANVSMLYNGLKGKPVDQTLLERVWTVYSKKRDELKKVYYSLPKGLIQGDFSPENFIVNNNKLAGIYDYNLAGNDTFISDAVQEGIFLTYEAYTADWMDEAHYRYMRGRFKKYIEGYIAEYPLSELEKEQIGLVYNICRPFRFDKVRVMLRKADAGLYGEVNERLGWMLYELERSDIMPYLFSS